MTAAPLQAEAKQRRVTTALLTGQSAPLYEAAKTIAGVGSVNYAAAANRLRSHMDVLALRKRAGVAAMTLTRYLLGLGMLPYALAKLERLQFELPAWSYAEPLAALNGRGLLWATMGYSPGLQMFLGLLELIPALLLLVRRTRRVGALLMFPVAANVWVLNMGLDLWPATKLISGFLLFLNVLLLAYDFRSYKRFLGELLAPPEPVASVRWRRVGHVAAFVVPLACVGLFLGTVERQIHTMHDAMSPFIGARQINRTGTWKVLALNLDGRPAPLRPEESSLYFDFGSRVVTGTPANPIKAHFAVDPVRQSVKITDLAFAGSASPIDAKYTRAGDTLQIIGTRDGKPFQLALLQEGWGPH